MNASIRCYRLLMRFYPADFRAEFGDSVEQAFRDLLREAFRRSGYRGIVRLWLRILPDLAFSAWQLLTSSSADYLKWHFRLRWVLACGLGSVLANLVGGILAASGIQAMLTSIGLPERWTLGGVPALVCIALFQSMVLTRTFCRPARWIFFSGLGGLLGISFALAVSGMILPAGWDLPQRTLDLLLRGALFQAPAALVGFLVGLFQWFAFTNKSVSATRWALACMFGAYFAPVTSLVVIAGTFSLTGGRFFPVYLAGLMSGCVFGLITAGPLKRILWPDSREESSAPALLSD